MAKTLKEEREKASFERKRGMSRVSFSMDSQRVKTGQTVNSG